MWTREQLKTNAKSMLRNYYWVAFAICLIFGIISQITNGDTPKFNFNIGLNNHNTNFTEFSDFNNFFNGQPFMGDSSFTDQFRNVAGFIPFLGILAIGFSFLAIARFALSLFVTNVFEVGVNRYFLSARMGDSNFNNIAYGFKGTHYINIVKSMAWRYLFQFLWTLLFIIPGIIKGLAYSMVPFILAENPNIDYRRALKLSMAMTDGEKWDIFVLQLSFIGWYLLGLLACCIGVIFVVPYNKATFTELYAVLKNQALSKGICTIEEFGGEYNTGATM